ncbi:MAG: MraY family glycosyltransferase, partial [Myxococcota bacterium]
VSNAFNIIDVSDGLSSSTGAVAALAFAALAILAGDVFIACACLALAGACIGFLRYNMSPASIYLGDAGSLFIGFLLACLSLIGSYTTRNVFAAAAPVAILFIPILDTALCSVARIAKGLSPMNGSDDHFALRLKAAGWSSNRVAGLSAGVTALMGSAAIAMVLSPPHVAAVILLCLGSVFVVALLALYFLFPPKSERSQLALSDDQPTTSDSIESQEEVLPLR